MSKLGEQFAFPVAAFADQQDRVHNFAEFGMTLRQYYAGQQMAALNSNPIYHRTQQELATMAVEASDALLAALEKPVTLGPQDPAQR